MKQTRPKQKTARKQAKNPDNDTLVLFRSIEAAQRQSRIIRRVVCDHASISTNGSGVVAVQSLFTSSGVTGTANWASFAGSAIEYRVRGIEVQIFPLVDAQTNLTSPAPAYLVFCAYSSFSAPATFQQVMEGPGSKVVSGFLQSKFAATPKGYIDSELWTPCTAGVATTENFGIMVAGPPTAPVAAISSTYFRVVAKYLIEFRSLD
jgi:hypothetical protein